MKAAIGIDIGGTNVRVGLVLELGEVIHQSRIEVATHTEGELFLNQLIRTVHEFLAFSEDLKILGIGIGSPGANIEEGIIERASNLPWKRLPIVERLSSHFDLPVFLTNDANLFAIAEKGYGHASQMTDFLAVTLGTGVGGGVYASDQLVTGANGLAGEVGHVIYERNGRSCKCGRQGCLERYVSASGVVETAKEYILAKEYPSELYGVPEHLISAQLVADSAKDGDVLAMKVFQETGKILGEALADFVAVLNPEAIFLSGGLSNSGDLLLKPTRASFSKSLLSIYPNEPAIRTSAIPDNDAGVLGASALVWEYSKKLNESSLTEI